MTLNPRKDSQRSTAVNDRSNRLDGRAAELFEFIAEFADALLLVFANQTQLGNDVGQLFDVLIFDHQVHGVLSKSLNDGSNHG